MRQTKVNSKWKTLDTWLHWDKNPWVYPDFSTVQGLITLTDHTEDSGWFCCILKFHLKLREWAENNLDYKNKNPGQFYEYTIYVIKGKDSGKFNNIYSALLTEVTDII